MKCIEKAKNYWHENKDDIIRKAEGLAVLASVYAFGTFVGFIAGDNIRDKQWKEDVSQYVRLSKKAIGKHAEEDTYLLAVNRDKDPKFDRVLEQAASTGRVTDDNGSTRRVLGAIMYAGDEINED